MNNIAILNPPLNAGKRAPGASPEDWMAWQALGLTTELLPVVSDPNAKISPLSNIREPGKVPSRLNQAGETVGIPRWPTLRSTDRDVERWAKEPRLGVCVQTRRVRALDIDIADPAVAREVRALIELMVDLPRRSRPNSGKCLLVFDMPGDFAKRVIRTAHGIIEFLATGQQFVACGQHQSGARYEWAGGLPTSVPVVTRAEFEVLWEALIKAFALPDGASEARNGVLPAVPRRAADMQDPRVAYLAENGWVTGYERDGKVNIRCPWEDGHSTDTGPSSTTYFPAGVGGFAQGHHRCLHASCGKRTDGDFDEATGYGAEEFSVVGPTPGEPEPLPALERDKMGRAEPTRSNLVAALSHGGGGHVAFDRFTGDLMLSEGSTRRKFRKTDYAALAVRLESGQARFKHVQKETLRDIVELVAAQNTFDSAQEWIEGLRWDGVHRVDKFCTRYFGAEDTPYARAVSRYLWSGFAARVIEPGAKCDMLPTLVGAQGTIKTTAIEALTPLPEAFGEIDLTKMDDDLTRKLRGKLVCEIAELKGLRSRDADSIKAWLSRRFEQHVEKWDTFTTRTPRRCMFIGTTNDAEFLDDDTGERRHLPLRVAGGDVAAIERDRDQLWAEGAVLFRREGVCWKDALDLAKAEHAEFKVVDAWHDDIAEFAGQEAGPLTTGAILERCIGLVRAHHTKAAEMRVGRVLSALGYAKRNTRVGGRMTRHWSKS